MNFLSIEILLWIIPGLVLIEAIFSGAEIALLSVDKLSLKHTDAMPTARKSGAQLALELANHPERVLSTTLLVTNLCMIAISALITLYFLGRAESQGTSHKSAEILAIAVTSPIILLFGELLPKTLFQRFAAKLAPWSAYPVAIAYSVFYPITRLISGYTTRLTRILGPIEEMISGPKRTTREQIESLLSYSKKESELKGSEKRMIKRIFDFRDSEAKHALIPLIRVEVLEAGETIRTALERFENHRHSRIPVYENRVDNIVGILEVRDLFGASDLEAPIRPFLSPPHYVAETQSLEDVLFNMKGQDDRMVVVVDEHGAAIGILTFEDIVEEVVGEIEDSHDRESATIRELSADSWLIPARMEVFAINESLSLEIPEGDYKTLSGFLLTQFGRIPESGDELLFKTERAELRFTVKKATARHIESVRVDKIDPDATEQA